MMMREIIHKTEDHTLKIFEGERIIGQIDYDEDRENKIITIKHTEVNPEFEGLGIAGAMTKEILEYIRLNGFRLIPTCSYTKTYITRHTEYEFLVVNNNNKGSQS